MKKPLSDLLVEARASLPDDQGDPLEIPTGFASRVLAEKHRDVGLITASERVWLRTGFVGAATALSVALVVQVWERPDGSDLAAEMWLEMDETTDEILPSES